MFQLYTSCQGCEATAKVTSLVEHLQSHINSADLQPPLLQLPTAHRQAAILFLTLLRWMPHWHLITTAADVCLTGTETLSHSRHREERNFSGAVTPTMSKTRRFATWAAPKRLPNGYNLKAARGDRRMQALGRRKGKWKGG